MAPYSWGPATASTTRQLPTNHRRSTGKDVSTIATLTPASRNRAAATPRTWSIRSTLPTPHVRTAAATSAPATLQPHAHVAPRQEPPCRPPNESTRAAAGSTPQLACPGTIAHDEPHSQVSSMERATDGTDTSQRSASRAPRYHGARRARPSLACHTQPTRLATHTITQAQAGIPRHPERPQTPSRRHVHTAAPIHHPRTAPLSAAALTPP